MTNFKFRKYFLYPKRRGAISLAEIIAALVIASLIAIATLRIYSRANATAESIGKFVEKDDIIKSLLQKIAHDIDLYVTPGTDAKLKLENKFADGFNICRLTIESRIFDKDNKPKTFEKVVWQSYYDIDLDGITIYRSYSGMNAEDKILDEYETMLNAWEGRELFVPVQSGLSFFKIDIPKAKEASADPLILANEQKLEPEDVEVVDSWKSDSLPTSIRLCASTGTVVELPDGGLGVKEYQKKYRTVAIDRIRKIEYKFIKKKFNIPDINDFPENFDINDINEFYDINDVNEVVSEEK